MIAIYVRVSTEEQAKKGYSLKDQLRECRVKAGSNEDIMEYIDEGISGEILDRPALSRLRNDVKEGLVSSIICLDPDRLSRKLMNQLIISEEIEKKARLIFVNGEYQATPEGKLFYQMRGAISEFEKAKINERMSRGRREKARQGRVVRNYRIYGYDYNNESGQLVINNYEAQIVKQIFYMFTGRNGENQGINGIAKYLTENAVPTKRGAGVWHRQVVRQILMNEAYVGRFYQNRWNTEGMLGNKYRTIEERVTMTERPKSEWIMISCPQIIEDDVFEYAQDILDQSRRRWSGKSRNAYLLGGLIKCGICGNTMTGTRMRNWGKISLQYADRKSTAGARNKGCGNRIRADILDNIIWNAVLKYLKENIDQDINDINKDAASLSRFEKDKADIIGKKLEETRKGKQNLITFLMSEGERLDKTGMLDIGKKLEYLGAQEKLLNARFSEALEYNSGGLPKNSSLGRSAKYYLFDAADELNTEEMKNLIRLAVKEVRVFSDRIEISGF